MANLLKQSAKRMWKLSLILFIAGVFNWYTNNTDPYSYEGILRLLVSSLGLFLIPIVLVAVVVYLEERFSNPSGQ